MLTTHKNKLNISLLDFFLLSERIKYITILVTNSFSARKYMKIYPTI